MQFMKPCKKVSKSAELKTQGSFESIVKQKWNKLVEYCSRVRTGPGKPGKSWNFVVAFSRTGKTWKKATGPGKFWKSV